MAIPDPDVSCIVYLDTAIVIHDVPRSWLADDGWHLIEEKARELLSQDLLGENASALEFHLGEVLEEQEQLEDPPDVGEQLLLSAERLDATLAAEGLTCVVCPSCGRLRRANPCETCGHRERSEPPGLPHAEMIPTRCVDVLAMVDPLPPVDSPTSRVRGGASKQEREAGRLAKLASGGHKRAIVMWMLAHGDANADMVQRGALPHVPVNQVQSRMGELRRDGWLGWRGGEDDEMPTVRGGHGRVQSVTVEGLLGVSGILDGPGGVV